MKSNPSEVPPVKVSFKDAAKKVLREAGKPLSAAEITDIAIERKIIATDGKTPAATMAAQIYIEIRDNPKSDFIKVKAGHFTLRNQKDSNDGEEFVARHNQSIKEKLHKYLHEIDPKEFEYLIAALLDKIGFENVEVTGGTGDGGIDLIGNLTVGGITNVTTVIQAKRFKSTIGSKVIRELRGSAELTKRGLIITTSDFSKDAITEADQANKMPISLVNGERLVELLVEHEVGIAKTNVHILSIDEEFLGQVIPEGHHNSGTTDKSLSIWPLPGGTDQYFATLVKYLDFVSSKSPTQKQATDWFIDSFDTVESEKTAKGYTGVPRSLGLAKMESGAFKLTELGQELLNDKTPDKLKEILEGNIVGVSEILAALKADALSERQIWTYLNDSLNLGWKTYAQTRFRLLWLQNANVIQKLKNGTYKLK